MLFFYDLATRTALVLGYVSDMWVIYEEEEEEDDDDDDDDDKVDDQNKRRVCLFIYNF